MRDTAAFLAALADIAGRLADLRDDAERMALPSAVVVGLAWLRDDAAGVLADTRNALRAEG